MEGKKYRAFEENCQAVSEVIGQTLMISIVVLAFSTIAMTVFSDGGAVKPPHTPYTSLREKTTTNRVEIIHSGGEAINLDEIKVVLIVNGKPFEFNVSSDPCVKVWDSYKKEKQKNGIFTLGDCMEIDTTEKITFNGNDSIEMLFVHTPSQQVIQKAVLQ